MYITIAVHVCYYLGGEKKNNHFFPSFYHTYTSLSDSLKPCHRDSLRPSLLISPGGHIIIVSVGIIRSAVHAPYIRHINGFHHYSQRQ